MKRALITGITGQDGSYLAELLLEKGYEVHGLVRRLSLEHQEARLSRIRDLVADGKVVLHAGDVTHHPRIWKLIAEVRPDEVYHLAAITSIPASFEDEVGTFLTNAASTQNLLAAIHALAPACRFYFAATSDLFSGRDEVPQNERTVFSPMTPYAIAKATGFYFTKLYRETHGIFACSGIAFSHESPRRGSDFLTRKVTLAVARIATGKEKGLRLGNLDARRDWGFAGDYVEAMWRMLQAEKPIDYIIGTGESHTIKEFVEAAFTCAGLAYEDHVTIDQTLFRAGEAREWLADPAKINAELGWKAKTTFSELVRMMVAEDMERATKIK